jgi:protein O-GlcNAc transferase
MSLTSFADAAYREASPTFRPERQAPGHQHWLSGVEFGREDRLTEAAEAFELAIGQAPTESLYWLNLASVRRRQHMIEDAVRCARRSFELDPHSILACHLLAELLRVTNRTLPALQVLQALHPDVERDVQHLLLETALNMTLGSWQAAAASAVKVLELEPAHLEAYQQLGFAFARLQRHSDAAECFRTVSLLEPQHGSIVYSSHYSAWACDWAAVAKDEPVLQSVMATLGDGGVSTAVSPFCLLSLNDDAAMHLKGASIASGRLGAQARSNEFSSGWTAPLPGPEGFPLVTASPRCRVGFVSADFRSHATSILLVRTLERLDRSHFEVIIYSHGKDDDTPLRKRMEAAADQFVDTSEMSAGEQCQRIRDDGVMILIDMSGHTAASRLNVFALRPAPIQVLWLAYPSTTGADYVDYVIGDPILTPLEHAEDFTEKIAQLPVCYEPTDDLREHPKPSSRAGAGLPEDAFVFACFNQSYKITEPVFDRWCRILHRVPNSVLWLLVPQASIQVVLRAEAVARGIAAERVIFAPFAKSIAHMARLPLADLFLDTFPYGAHTTCSDALWMGLPVVTQIGRSFSARVAASLLNAVGMPELVVGNGRDYEELAVLIANDEVAYRDIRTHLADNRMSLPLFDNARFSAEVAALFKRMEQRWRDGLAPEALPAESLGVPAG